MDNVIPVKQRRTRRKTNYKNAEQKNPSGLTPRTNTQKLFIDALKEHSQVFVLGPAGTGKTYVTATYAADLYILKKIDKIVITRPHIAVGKDLGYLPGSLEEKTYPWALPFPRDARDLGVRGTRLGPPAKWWATLPLPLSMPTTSTGPKPSVV